MRGVVCPSTLKTRVYASWESLSTVTRFRAAAASSRICAPFFSRITASSFLSSLSYSFFYGSGVCRNVRTGQVVNAHMQRDGSRRLVCAWSCLPVNFENTCLCIMGITIDGYQILSSSFILTNLCSFLLFTAEELACRLYTGACRCFALRQWRL